MNPRRLLILVAASPLLLGASVADDYAHQWPLALSRPAAEAHEVVLDAGVYRRMHDPAGRDVDVLDARGVPQPSLLMPPPAPRVVRARVTLPYFTLPVVDTGGPTSALVAETDEAGNLRRVELRGGDEVPGMPNQALLLDLSSARGPVSALEFHWQPSGPVDRDYAIEASDDLQRWSPIATRGRLVDLHSDGRRLLQQRIVLDVPPQARFLRLTPPADGRRLHVHRVDAVVDRSVGPPVQWQALQGRAGDVARTFVYRIDGRLPVQQVDVALPATGALRWSLVSRDGDEAPWRPRAGGEAFHVRGPNGVRRSPAQVLANPSRDREWRLATTPAAGAPPVLRLGYRPERLVFLAQGTPPYRLVAGSARLRRADAPLSAVLADLRAANGRDWRPAPARTGAPAVLAGNAALRPARDWTAWALWAALGLGVLVVAGFSLRLLREPARPA